MLIDGVDTDELKELISSWGMESFEVSLGCRGASVVETNALTKVFEDVSFQDLRSIKK